MLYIHGHAHTSTPVNTQGRTTQTLDMLRVALYCTDFGAFYQDGTALWLRHTGWFPHRSI